MKLLIYINKQIKKLFWLMIKMIFKIFLIIYFGKVTTTIQYYLYIFWSIFYIVVIAPVLSIMLTLILEITRLLRQPYANALLIVYVLVSIMLLLIIEASSVSDTVAQTNLIVLYYPQLRNVKPKVLVGWLTEVNTLLFSLLLLLFINLESLSYDPRVSELRDGLILSSLLVCFLDSNFIGFFLFNKYDFYYLFIIYIKVILLMYIIYWREDGFL